MKTSTSKLDVASHFPGMASRSMGSSALELVESTLRECDLLELDFGNKVPSPSFADEFVGGLAAHLGLDEFRRRVKIRNAPDDVLPLLRHVILRKTVGHRAP